MQFAAANTTTGAARTASGRAVCTPGRLQDLEGSFDFMSDQLKLEVGRVSAGYLSGEKQNIFLF